MQDQDNEFPMARQESVEPTSPTQSQYIFRNSQFVSQEDLWFEKCQQLELRIEELSNEKQHLLKEIRINQQEYQRHHLYLDEVENELERAREEVDKIQHEKEGLLTGLKDNKELLSQFEDLYSKTQKEIDEKTKQLRLSQKEAKESKEKLTQLQDYVSNLVKDRDNCKLTMEVYKDKITSQEKMIRNFQMIQEELNQRRQVRMSDVFSDQSAKKLANDLGDDCYLFSGKEIQNITEAQDKAVEDDQFELVAHLTPSNRHIQLFKGNEPLGGRIRIQGLAPARQSSIKQTLFQETQNQEGYDTRCSMFGQVNLRPLDTITQSSHSRQNSKYSNLNYSQSQQNLQNYGVVYIQELSRHSSTNRLNDLKTRDNTERYLFNYNSNGTLGLEKHKSYTNQNLRKELNLDLSIGGLSRAESPGLRQSNPVSARKNFAIDALQINEEVASEMHEMVTPMWNEGGKIIFENADALEEQEKSLSRNSTGRKVFSKNLYTASPEVFCPTECKDACIQTDLIDFATLVKFEQITEDEIHYQTDSEKKLNQMVFRRGNLSLDYLAEGDEYADDESPCANRKSGVERITPCRHRYQITQLEDNFMDERFENYRINGAAFNRSSSNIRRRLIRINNNINQDEGNAFLGTKVQNQVCCTPNCSIF